MTKNSYTLEYSTQFVNSISLVFDANDYFMASFDAQNFFTSIPFHETIDISIVEELFKSLLQLAVLNSFLTGNLISKLKVLAWDYLLVPHLLILLLAKLAKPALIS